MQRLATDAGPVHRPGPQADPKFAALKADVRGKQQVLGAHPPAASEASKAQGAAKAPQDDREAQGKAANAEKMNAAKPREFDKAAFVRAVNEAIAAQAPKNLDEADKFGDSGKADAVKGQVQGQVTDGKKASANTIETTTKAPPDTSQAVDKPVTPLVVDKPPATPGTPDPAKAVPDKAPPAATDLSGGPKQVDQQMADAQVTEEQLAKSNEPEFTGALKEKDAVEQHAATAPGQVRAAEAQTLTGAKAAAGAAGATAMTALAGDRKQAGQAVGAGKEQAKSADEVKRAQVTATLQKVFDATKKDVEEILSGLDKKVDEKFSTGEKAARDAFTAEHTRLMDAYKDKRYSGLLGKGRWIKDKFAGLPDEANQIFVTARKGYVDRMQQVISGVADVIGAELTRAKQRIATGRTELQAAVKGLAPELQAIGKEAAGEFAGKFDELTESVNNKGTELVQTLASKYNEALKSVDEEIAAEKEKNKGLVAKAVDAVAGVIKTIMQLKDMLMGVLAKAAQAVMAIIKDPIGFLGNLVSAVGAGLKQFMANIGEHLKKGLVGWLTGAMAGAGLELPAKFDLRGIVLMVGSLLGLTWASIRGLIIKRGVPEPAMGAVEKAVPIVQKVQAQGLGGLWEEIQDKVGDLKANLFSKISEYLIPTVLMAGITWIISLLNPASAFVRAVKMIIDFVTFIVTQGAQILEFVNSVLDAIIAIAGGGTGGVPALIEKALARSVPVLIGVLAAVLGVGGIAQRVQKFFKGLAAPVMKAVGWVADKVAAIGKKLWARLKARAKAKREARSKQPGDLRGGLRAAYGLLRRGNSVHQVEDGLPGIQKRYRLASMRLVVESRDDNFTYAHAEGTVQRTSTATTAIPAGPGTGQGGNEREDNRKKLVNAKLLHHGGLFVDKVLAYWWKRQLEKTRLWDGPAILQNTHGTGQAKLSQSPFQQQVYGKFFAGRRTDPQSANAWDGEVFKKGSGTRGELVETLGKHAEGALRPAVIARELAPRRRAVREHGVRFRRGPVREFDPLPAGSKDANVDLVKAVGDCGGIIDFLRVVGGGGQSNGIGFVKFKQLWDEDSNSKNWIKNQFRLADSGKHEWIPTNYIARVLEVAVGRSSEAARGAQIAQDWITLQHALRSFTSHVVWQVSLAPDAAEVGKEGIQAHVGGFTRAGNPMFNGKDGKWHKDLRAYFDDFVAGNPTAAPAEFLDRLLDKLDSGDLMWDGDLADVNPSLHGLPIDAVYKVVTIKGEGTAQETIEISHESGLTISKLAALQSVNFNRVRLDFTRARAALKVT